MKQLGHAAEAKAAKGVTDVQAALAVARANPRAAADATAAAAGSGEESGEESEGDADADADAFQGEDVYAVEDVVAKRRQGG
eukprot:5918574-Prymnesium_polylepis.1